MQGNSYINLVTIFTISAKLPPPLQQFQWLRPTSELGRAKISENKMEVGLSGNEPQGRLTLLSGMPQSLYVFDLFVVAHARWYETARS
jgi:hypothetical protein